MLADLVISRGWKRARTTRAYIGRHNACAIHAASRLVVDFVEPLWAKPEITLLTQVLEKQFLITKLARDKSIRQVQAANLGEGGPRGAGREDVEEGVATLQLALQVGQPRFVVAAGNCDVVPANKLQLVGKRDRTPSLCCRLGLDSRQVTTRQVRD